MDIKNILEKELEKISLPEEKITSLKKLADEFVNLLKTKEITARIGGSLAKGTLIKKSSKQDIDIFVVFDYSEDIINLEKILNKIKLPGKLKKVHGSRDYFQIDCEDALLEVIPVVKNSDPELAENVTDVSLSHVKYVTDEIKKNPQISSQIKLTKAFCKANKSYGAESYIKGFSGYSLEILTIHFGGFIEFLKGMQKAKAIDTMKYFKGEREIMTELNASKLNSPIVVIDPTYKYRNAVAGLSIRTFLKFVEKSEEFLKNPSLDFFKEEKINLENLKKISLEERAPLVKVNLKTDRQEGDIAGTKMKKVLDFFVKELVKNKQEVLREEFEYDSGQNSIAYLIVKEKNKIKSRGPPVGLEEPIKKFKKARGESVFKKNGYYWSMENTSIEKVLSSVKKVEKEMGAEINIKKI